MAKLPLEGIRVVEVTLIWAGPFATQLLSDWGAEGIVVESLQRVQDLHRTMFIARPPKEMVPTMGPLLGGYPDMDPGEHPYNRNAFFNTHGRNRYSATMDLSRPKGVEMFKRLIEKSDVFIENNAFGYMTKLGIGYEALKEVKPDIIMISAPGFGNSGPYKGFRALGAHLEHFCGHTLLRGYADSDPSTTTTVYHCDASAGASIAFAAVMALRHRNKTGQGQFIDMAQIETVVPQLGEAMMDYSMNQRVQRTTGNRYASHAPCGAYRCQGEDQWITIDISTDNEWEGLCKVMGNPSWTKDAKFSNALSRFNNQDELDTHIGAWTADRDKYELFHILQKEGVPAGPVLTPVDWAKDVHITERKFYEKLIHPEAGTHLYPGIIGKMSNSPNAIRMPPPCLGEHNEYVYKQIIGVSDAEYEELVREKHIGTEFIEG